MTKVKYALISAIAGLVGGMMTSVILPTYAGRNGSGTYTLPAGNPVVTGTQISSTWANNTLTDIATALSASIAKDGQTVPTANLPMGGFHHTGVSDASSRSHYAAAGQVQDSSLTLAGTVAGTDTITASLTPAISAYADGMHITLTPANDNTGAATLALNGLTAHDIVKGDGGALAASDMMSGVPAELVYDLANTRFNLINPQTTITAITPSALAYLSSANVFTTNQKINVAGAGLVLKGAATGASNIGYLQFQDSAGTVTGYVGDAASGDSDITLNSQAGKVALSSSTGITLDGVASTDFARLSQSNTFTHSQFFTAVSPSLILHDTGGGTNEKATIIEEAGGLFQIASLNDADMSDQQLLAATRSSTSWASLALTATAITLNGVDVSTYMVKGNNLSDLTSASTARTNLGLGTLATQSNINDSDWSGAVLSLANGGTGQSNATGLARVTTLAWTIASDPGTTPSGSPGDVFAYY